MDLKELLEKYFKDALTEGAQTEIETLFEALVQEAVDARVKDAEAKLEEKYAAELKEFKEGLIEKLSDYLEETFTEWADENKPAMVGEAKVLMAETVMKSMKGVLSENYVEIKEEEVDVIADLEKNIADLTGKLDESGNANIDLKKQIFEYEKAVAFTKLTDGMALTDKESLLKLVNGIDANDIKAFTEKATILKEKMIEASSSAAKELSEGVIDPENPDGELKESEVDKYLPKTY